MKVIRNQNTSNYIKNIRKKGMNLCIILAINILSFGFTVYGQEASLLKSRTRSFDQGWRFLEANPTGAENPIFDDSNWRLLDLPHDWSIEDLPNQTPGKVIGPFSKASAGKWATGHTVGGTGWYRKKFTINPAEKNKLVAINFDGVFMNSDVWINGHHVGNHPHGYTPFYYDLTPYLKSPGQENVLAVRVCNEGVTSRWYSGSGIYRHVWLTVTNRTHIIPWGVYITTPEVSVKNAKVNVSSTIKNEQATQKNIRIETTILTPAGKVVEKSLKSLIIGAGKTTITNQQIKLLNPALWSVEKPILYKAVTRIKEGNNTIDRLETSFGIRKIQVDAKTGLTINGKKVLLKGGCVHSDNGPLGTVTIDRAEERKVEILKKNGFNAIRSSHNPPSKQFLEACDRLGMLVIDEAFDMWEEQKTNKDYHLYFKEWWKRDLDAMILRDRNHPSVIFWSVGNEIHERVDSSGIRIVKQLIKETKLLDPTRQVTEALCSFYDRPDYPWDTTATAFGLLDVAGYNYMMDKYESDHDKFPNRIILGTESFANKSLENWTMVEKHPYIIGDFVWTAMDYIGEASLGHANLDSEERKKVFLPWPWFNSWCGDIDLIGNKKVQSYYRDVVWRNSPIEMAVHTPIPKGMIENVSDWGWMDEIQSWTWPGVEGQTLQVRVFSRSPIVRLLLNGKVIGEEKIEEGSITAVFNVPYQPGILKAVNIKDGQETDAVELRTTGTPKAIRLRADRSTIHADRNDLSYVMVEIVDNKGQVVPNESFPVQFSINGVGEIAGVGSGSPTDMASFQKPERNTFNGRCLVIVRPKGIKGRISLSANSTGLTSDKLEINVN